MDAPRHHGYPLNSRPLAGPRHHVQGSKARNEQCTLCADKPHNREYTQSGETVNYKVDVFLSGRGIKLTRELAKRDTGRTLYILNEPPTGLHFQDIRMLLKVLNRLRDAGNTVIVIEHNLDVIKTADWIIDLGPEGGHCGGRIVAQGTPEAVAQVSESHMGRYLKEILG